ncbi:CoA-substrate-specific enzyme activase domain protein [Leadbettera azotonutricia ZAS-9]|uniref:CoA-substrate-specific enzyme activase domain protein n=1 Tax=Leadbettera azotonutricia (strain ATCC BAA-888 / DSM 13862 / ZAS-9) TaxID=545695 RepID=F5YAT7_LEAAZ|nr:CoA-substrate-specific enzyme activase domain protein [Leadbettera azotonutricia ZAS-9]
MGSTTAKAVIVDPQTNTSIFSRYTRHNARQIETVHDLLSEISIQFPDTRFRAAVCGSGGKSIAGLLQVPYVQEVVANSIAIKRLYPKTRIAIELGGQDAKIVFFYYDKATNKLNASDMRMNGSCAGGTGAFIDEVASLLKIPVEQFEAYAAKGTFVYDISGRCGVFAKTDIQPLLNQGARKEDICLSTFHAIAKQTIGGLAQGLELKPPITFEGGPLTFNPSLIRVFSERLNLNEDDIIWPKSPETLVACGAALSLGDLFADRQEEFDAKAGLTALASYRDHLSVETQRPQKAWFDSEEEKKAFYERHKPFEVPVPTAAGLQRGQALRVYLGIDSGSTTTKFVLLDENENVIDTFYSNNSGDPLHLIRDALIKLDKKYQDLGITLEIIAAGTTGYGELLFYKALRADYHSVETVAHAAAARKYVPGATFILDIGGQDMKAITIARDIVTDITLNEACSAGCGSFLENFAKSLNIPVAEIAEAAFDAKDPAELGSRCTVFMNSCIITEQRNGKQADDLMAGLCRSIIDNVFTKVVRVSNFASLGDKIVVQGGTFKNDAVLRALEQYTGKPITRSPYPGEIGAIGIALLTKKHVEETPDFSSRFIGLGAMKDFNYTQESNSICRFCSNNCSRTLLRFSSGTTYVTGNRCQRGEIIGDLKDTKIREKVKQLTEELDGVPDLMKKRDALLFKNYPFALVNPEKDITIGLPRSLEFWDSMPFWTTFWKSLGFKVQISRPSSRHIFEQGLPFVASDTICFPAKLVHGHIRDLADSHVDRIFMPMIIRNPSENIDPLSDHLCAVVKGYPLVIQYSDNPARRWNTIFDTPMFHWFSEKDRNRQICDFMQNTFNLAPHVTREAIDQGSAALKTFREDLRSHGAQVIADLEKKPGAFAVVLAGRPYHNDELVNHDLSRCFIQQGIPVLTVDSLPGINQIDLKLTRTEIVNNFHSRILSGAIAVAQHPALEYVQIVSFGCGHDAILSDEVIRVLNEISGKTPLILKLDESSISGPLTLRVKSFIETVKTRRAKGITQKPRSLKDPYPVKFTKQDWKKKTILIPNVSRAFCQIVSAAIARQGFNVEPLPMGGRDAIKLGKKYVHNDICFPAQMNIGEALSVLESGKYDTHQLAIGMGKYQCDCRLAQYTSLARKAFDEAGFGHVPIITTDKLDSKNMFPGFRLELVFEIRVIWGLIMADILEDLRRKIRPYEKNQGETDQVFSNAMDAIMDGLARKGIAAAIKAYKKGIASFCEIPYDRSSRKGQVLITGEFLLSFHPGSNFEVESYLEKYNMEVIMPRLADVFWRDYVRMKSEVKDFHVSRPFQGILFAHIGDGLFNFIVTTLEKTAFQHPLYEASMRLPDLADLADPVMHRTFTSGEGYLIPGEIIHHARAGVRSFIILQPFGCLPNHISGRGVVKRLKEDFPGIQILPLDYDPDTSFANIENRLQMLIMNARE